MNTKIALYQLIQSLSGSEKRYLTSSFARAQGSYAKLYRAILNQAVYNETAIREQFEGEPFLRQLSVAKSYLYNHILKSLKAYHQNRTLSMELRDGLDKVDLLWQRNLHHQSLPWIFRIRRKATQLEVWSIWLESLEKEMVLIRRSGTPDMQSKLENLFIEQETALKGLTLEATFRQLYNQIFVLRRKTLLIRSQGDKATLKAIMKHPALLAPAPASFRQAILYHYIHLYAASLLGIQEEVYLRYRSLIQIWKSDGILIKHDQERYFRAIANFIDLLIESETPNAPEIEELFQEISNLKITLPSLQRIRDFTLLHLRIRRYLNSGKFREGAAYFANTRNLEATLKKSTQTAQLSILNNLLVLFFLGGNFSQALKFANRILDAKNDGLRQDIQYFARLLLLPIHYELGNSDLLGSLIRSARRYFGRRDDLGDFERVFFRHFRQLEKAVAKEKEDQALADLMLELNKFQGKLMGIEELKLWLEGKIE